MAYKYVPKVGWAAYQRDRRAKKRAAGICVFCARPAVPGNSRCQDHIEYQTVYKTEWTRLVKEGE